MSIKNACRDIFVQLSDLINQLSDHEYSKPIETLNQSSIGQHIRHTLEFFMCLEQADEAGVVNYDKRLHDKLIETDKVLALAAVNRLSDFIMTHDQNRNLNLEVNYSIDGEGFIVVGTNYSRELIYNIEHAVHHMAIIKIGVREVAPHISLPVTFGVASSTIRHQARNSVTAQQH